MKKLTDKQALFVKEYLIDLNATQAAIRAGYSKKTANREGSRLLSKVDIQKAIQNAQKARNEKLNIDAQCVLRRLIEIDRLDIADILDDAGNLLPIIQWSSEWRRSVSAVDLLQATSSDSVESVIRKIKMPDKLRNLELLGRHVGIQAFSDKKEHITNTPEIVINRVAYDDTNEREGEARV